MFDPEQTSNLVRLAVACIVPIAFALSWRAIRRRGSASERAEFVSNLKSGGVVYLLSTSTLFALRLLADSILTGHGPWHLESPALALLVSFVIVDLASYLYHVLAHKTGLLWAFHVVHHSGRHFNLSLGPRQSWLERALITPLCYVLISLPLCWGLNLSFWYLLIGHQLVFFIGFMNHTTAFARWPLGLGRVLINPIEHRVHHGVEAQHFDCNYGFALVVWDQLFGTYRRPDAPMDRITVGVSRCPYSERTLDVQAQALSHLARLARADHGLSGDWTPHGETADSV
jgi:sterol desaturase/sphingolipid hydroxylase (fatty acid hydroxylase superfamily)